MSIIERTLHRVARRTTELHRGKIKKSLWSSVLLCETLCNKKAGDRSVVLTE